MEQTQTQNQTPIQQDIPQLLTEIARPKTLQSIILLPRIQQEIQTTELKSNFLFYSGPGTGKTSLTRILARGKDTLIINGSADNGIDIIREKIQTFCSSYSVIQTEGAKVVIIEECDGLSLEAWKALRAVMEKFASTTRFILNCNYIDKIPDPIKSRFNIINFNPINQEETEYLFEQYKTRTKLFLNALHIEYTEVILETFIRSVFPDFRSILTKIQSLRDRGVKQLTSDSINQSFDLFDLFNIATTLQNPWENYAEISSKYANNAYNVIISFGKDFIDYIKSAKPELIRLIPQFIITIWEHENSIDKVPDKLVTLLSLVFSIQNIVRKGFGQ